LLYKCFVVFRTSFVKFESQFMRLLKPIIFELLESSLAFAKVLDLFLLLVLLAFPQLLELFQICL
jgi:hypothetical protein